MDLIGLMFRVFIDVLMVICWYILVMPVFEMKKQKIALKGLADRAWAT